MFGTAWAEGDLSVLQKLATTMVDFDPRFEILLGTHPDGTTIAKHNAYEAVLGNSIAEKLALIVSDRTGSRAANMADRCGW